MTAGTDFSATVAWVAEKLGLPGIPYESALNASDKARMRSCFKKAGLPSPEYITIQMRNEKLEIRKEGQSLSESSSLSSFLPSLSSFVVKPVDNMGGRGCRRVNNPEEFREAAEDALRFSRSGRAIAEAFMEGPEFSVDAIVYHGEITICGLADRHIFFPPYFIEMGHTMPTCFPAGQQEAILETFCAGVRALGLAGPESVGSAKGDIKLTPQGPMIGEIAARLSGGYMSGWTYPYSSGVEPVRAAILAATGRKPDGLAPTKNWTSAERAFISIPGTVKSITGVEAARNLPHVQDLFLRAEEGGKVAFPVNNVSKCGNIISAAPDRATAVEAADQAARSILIRLDPKDNETQTFLEGSDLSPQHSKNSTTEDTEFHGESEEKLRVSPWFNILPVFPPDAFQLGTELKAALTALPETRVASSTAHCSLLTAHCYLLSFPAFSASGLTDYTGRTVAESLCAVRELTGLPLQEITQESAEFSDNRGSFLGKSFWTALVRGGYQGAVYYIDRLGMKDGDVAKK
jgi:biotin carboxylase